MSSSDAKNVPFRMDTRATDRSQLPHVPDESTKAIEDLLVESHEFSDSDEMEDDVIANLLSVSSQEAVESIPSSPPLSSISQPKARPLHLNVKLEKRD